MEPWTHTETAYSDFKDKRLRQRLIKLLDSLSKKPSESIPGSCTRYHETLAAYRFFDNEKVTYDAILSSHRENTVLRMKDEDVILCVQDTTSLDYTTKEVADELGHIENEYKRGLFLHPTIALNEEGVCLGITDAPIWTRDKEQIGKRHIRYELPLEEKESYRWLESYRNVVAISKTYPDKTFITIGDRENDIYEVFAETVHNPSVHVVIRACRDRRTIEDGNFIRLWNTVSDERPSGTITLDIPQTDTRKARKAALDVRTKTVEIVAPYRKQDFPQRSVVLQAVLVKEKRPPRNEKPIEWLLLTTLPVHSHEDAVKIIEHYRYRWLIEIFFKIFKQGCAIEQRQMETVDRLECCIALFLIIAWRIQYLMSLGRKCPQVPADTVFTHEELLALFAVDRHEVMKKVPSLNEAIVMVASLGGYFNRKHDLPPGPKHLWKGLSRLTDFVISYNAFKKLGKTYV
ncbi:MAG: IS4 family transposase [Endomicrobiales bacterium]